MNRFVIETLAAGAAVAGLSLAATGTAFAFGGCVDSPENPTWLLAGIGGEQPASLGSAPRSNAAANENRGRDDRYYHSPCPCRSGGPRRD